jgi:hypothetical protein
MSDKERRCPRCRGQKSIFKIGRSGYTLENFGGEKVDCPSCLGSGYVTIPSFVEAAKEELKEIVVKRRKKKELVQDVEVSKPTREETQEEDREELHA